MDIDFDSDSDSDSESESMWDGLCNRDRCQTAATPSQSHIIIQLTKWRHKLASIWHMVKGFYHGQCQCRPLIVIGVECR